MVLVVALVAFWAGGLVATALASFAELRANPETEPWRLAHVLGLLAWPLAWVHVFRRGRA
jgi:hypothetical protein